MPGTQDVGSNILELRASGKDRPQKQVLAIALSQARAAGNRNIMKQKVVKPKHLNKRYGV